MGKFDNKIDDVCRNIAVGNGLIYLEFNITYKNELTNTIHKISNINQILALVLLASTISIANLKNWCSQWGLKTLL